MYWKAGNLTAYSVYVNREQALHKKLLINLVQTVQGIILWSFTTYNNVTCSRNAGYKSQMRSG